MAFLSAAVGLYNPRIIPGLNAAREACEDGSFKHEE